MIDNPIQNITLEEFTKIISNPSIPIIDVRTPAEYTVGHFERAVNCDIYDMGFVDLIEALALDTTAPIAVYCHSGVRSSQAAEVLLWMGFRGTVYNLIGGYEGYEKSLKK